MYRKLQQAGAVFLLIAGLNLGLWGCGSEREAPQEPPPAEPVPALRFAGVDLVYALRRLAAEADMLLALDEIQSGPLTTELGRFRVDVDLEMNSAASALDQLKQHTGAFDYTISDNLIYVRSALTLKDVTALDIKGLPETTLTVDIEGLVRWIMSVRPGSFLRVKRIRGEPIFKKVELEVTAESSVLDLLIEYAKQADRGWRIRRGGQQTTDPQGRLAIVANTVALWPPLDKPDPLHKFRSRHTTLSALASISVRTGTPICIKDRSPFGDIRGWLDYGWKLDPKTPAEEAVQKLSRGSRRPDEPDYEWEWVDGAIRVTTQFYNYYLPGRDLLRDTVKGGKFEGTLPGLARWINENRSSPPRKILMGGEITDEAPAARLDIAEGTSVEEVLLDFARTSGAGWNLVIVDTMTPDASATEIPTNAWRGAYLMPLDIWSP